MTKEELINKIKSGGTFTMKDNGVLLEIYSRLGGDNGDMVAMMDENDNMVVGKISVADDAREMIFDTVEELQEQFLNDANLTDIRQVFCG